MNFISKFIKELQNTLYTMTDHNNTCKVHQSFMKKLDELNRFEYFLLKGSRS